MIGCGPRARSKAAEIETIYQDIALVDSISITRNIFMGRKLINWFGFMDQKRMEETAIEILGGAVQISGIDNLRKEVGFLSGGQKQAVAIARAASSAISYCLTNPLRRCPRGRPSTCWAMCAT
jgi:simple sugar transport system ATP-binding protein